MLSSFKVDPSILYLFQRIFEAELNCHCSMSSFLIYFGSHYWHDSCFIKFHIILMSSSLNPFVVYS
jgi:hypothetical protein